MNRIKALREQRGLTQEKLSKYVGINRTTISKLESGDREFTLDHLTRLSNFFGCSFEYIQGLSDERTNTIQVIDMVNTPNGVSQVQLEILKRVEDLDAKDVEQIMDYIDFIKSKEKKK